MRHSASVLVLVTGLLASCASPAAEESAGAVRWVEWGPEAFASARATNRLVLLDLGAVWCHWCHVMDEETYGDPGVRLLLAKGFVCVRVDQAEKPDLAHRYEDYGWPATIILNGEGEELVKRRGYIPPAKMRALLSRITANPKPLGDDEDSTGDEAALSANGAPSLGTALTTDLERSYDESYDAEHASWGFVHKFLPKHPTEYALFLAVRGEPQARKQARDSLIAQLALLDDAWGGMYQYSHGGDWTHPHFEKIMAVQADDLMAYSRSALRFSEPRCSGAADAIADYILTFLRGPEGAFRPSQDADLVKGRHAEDYFALDDAGRRARGIPEVDPHIFTAENGWAIRALALHHEALGRQASLDAAVRAAQWILAHRSLPGGGFRHEDDDDDGPYLGDSLAMGQAFLELHRATGEPEWLERAANVADFIAEHFVGPKGGFLTAALQPDLPLPPLPNRDENIEMARWGLRLAHQTGAERHQKLADRAFAWLARPRIARLRPTAGVLLAFAERSEAPREIVVVGKRDDPATQDLYQVALAQPRDYRRLVRWHPTEGALAGAQFPYPDMGKPAVFVCEGGVCSSPIFEARALRKRLAP